MCMNHVVRTQTRHGQAAGVRVAAALVVGLAAGLLAPVQAAERPPVLSQIQPPSQQPQGYWICEYTGSGGQCVGWKTCVRWELGMCAIWIHVSINGSFYCDDYAGWGVDCPAVTHRLAGGAGSGRNLQVWSGELRTADGRSTGVSVTLFVYQGSIVLMNASSEPCSPNQRGLLAQFATLWSGRDPAARQTWSNGGCAVTVAHRDFQRWLLQGPEQDSPARVDPGGRGER